MSLDLLKEFGGLQHISTQQDKTTPGDSIAEEDDFGDFQDVEEDSLASRRAEPSQQQTTLPGRASDLRESSFPASVYGQPLKKDLGKLTSKDLELGVPTGTNFPVELHPSQKPSSASSARDDNDWGEFGDSSVDDSILFDADHFVSTKGGPRRTTNRVAPRVFPKKHNKPQLLDIQDDTEDSFDNWEPQDAPQTPITPSKGPLTLSLNQAQPPSIPETMVTRKGLGPPPSNIPPPSILLSLITRVLPSLAPKIKATTASDQVPSDTYEPPSQSQTDQLKREISSMTAIARIIAGRKLRWKRDALLSQSMKIGPAGKQGGMKLAGVDKTESRREDQEVAETLRIWRQQVGSVRSMIATVNVHLPGNGLVVPEILESMPIRLLKANEGALTAPKCCFLCGLKREERVYKVDGSVDDSFGEWWTEYWGHVDCVGFWMEYRSTLAQR